MKNLLTVLCVALSLGEVAEASKKCCPKEGNTCCSTGQTTRWYKAKDGTFREMMPYMKALDRAEDADDMEPVLKQTQADLAAANTKIESVTAEAAQAEAAMEAQIAELTKQLEAEKQVVASQKERGDKAEAAHKLCIEEVAQLREAGKKQEEALTATKAELKTVVEERDTLNTAKADLEKQVADVTAAKTAAEDALKAAQAELEKMKQEAAESKKAAVEGEPAAEEGADPAAGGEKPPEPGVEPTPEAPPAGN